MGKGENSRKPKRPSVWLTICWCLGFTGLICFGGLSFVFAGSGGSDDPLVTRSYVLEQIEKAISSLQGNQGSGGTYEWQIMELAPGQRLEGIAGTEMIVRAGSAVLVDPSGSGVPDITAGSNVRSGATISLNHQLLIPRTDGRGFVCQGNKNVIVMYRGEVSVY